MSLFTYEELYGTKLYIIINPNTTMETLENWYNVTNSKITETD